MTDTPVAVHLIYALAVLTRVGITIIFVHFTVVTCNITKHQHGANCDLAKIRKPNRHETEHRHE